MRTALNMSGLLHDDPLGQKPIEFILVDRYIGLIIDTIESDGNKWVVTVRDPHPSHDDECHIRKRPPWDYEMGNPDSEQHCERCHCSCNPDGPGCGHWAGCPGC